MAGDAWFEGDLLSNGIRIHYRRTGSGDKPALILLHGFSDNGLCWLPVAQALEADYDIIMPDARGHGRSEAPVGPYGIVMADDVAGLADVLGLDRPILMGHSMGGITAFTAAGRYPERFRCILLEDPAMRTPEQERALEEAAKEREIAEGPRDWGAQLRQMRELPHEEIVAIGRQQSPNWPEIELGPWATSKQQVSLNLLNARFDRGESWVEVLSRITCPVLLIVPDLALGGITTPEAVQQASSLLGTLEVATIPGAGHNVRREQFAAFMEAVRAFLGRYGS
jgi:pimeloyl-ACP methyl ester carboxylesterase